MNPKFTGLALAGLLAQAAATKPAFAQRKVSTKSLRKMQRKLEEEELTGDYSVSFNTCMHIKVNDENLYDDNYVALTQNGYVEAVKSMVVFDVCKTEYCGYEGNSNMHSIDLATWVGSLVEAPVNKKEAYCEACRESDEYCNAEEEEEEEEAEEDENNEEEDEEDKDEEENEEDEEDDKDEDEEEGENDEEGEEDDKDDEEDRKRKLAVAKRHLAGNYVDCDTCAAQGCFDEDEEDQGDDAAIQDEDVVEWIQELAECVQLDEQYNDMNLYAGLTCNGEGTGVTIGIFVDEDCTLLTNQQNVKNVMANDGDFYALYQNSANLMTYSFINDVSCEQVEYQALGDDEEEEQDEDEEEQNEANEVCQNLVGGDMYSKLGYCEVDEDEEEEEDDENENNWYSYDLTADQAEDAGAICQYITDFEGKYEASSNVDYEHSEDNEGGTLYDYSAGKSGSDGSGGMVIGIIVLVLAIIGVTVAAVSACTKKSSSDSKREPLNKNGQMA